MLLIVMHGDIILRFRSRVIEVKKWNGYIVLLRKALNGFRFRYANSKRNIEMCRIGFTQSEVEVRLSTSA